MQLVQASLCGPEQQRIEGKHQHTREWQPRRTPIRTFNRNTEVKFVWWKIVFFIEICKIQDKCCAQADLLHATKASQ
jgi:hypothetical protein